MAWRKWFGSDFWVKSGLKWMKGLREVLTGHATGDGNMWESWDDFWDGDCDVDGQSSGGQSARD
jgi:hypothetical protein